MRNQTLIDVLFGLRNEGTDLGKWIFREAVRRARLSSAQYCSNYVVSYPRSGNHATRFALEFLSRRPTLGASDHESYVRPRGLHDLPIFLSGGRPVKHLSPVALKRHRLKKIDVVSKLIYIERHPIEAVLSHAANEGKATAEELCAELEHWRSLREAFEHFPAENKLLIDFDEILSGNREWIRQMVDFLEIDAREADISLCAESLSQAKKTLTRKPQTTGTNFYREKYPQSAAIIASALAESGWL